MTSVGIKNKVIMDVLDIKIRVIMWILGMFYRVMLEGREMGVGPVVLFEAVLLTQEGLVVL